MYNTHQPYPCHYWVNTPMYNPHHRYNDYRTYPYPYWANPPVNYPDYWSHFIILKDYGPEPFVVNIEKATKQNNTFRTALWTGEYLQLTLMSINVGDDIGLEIHDDHDQFIRIEEGQGIVKMGDRKDRLDFQAKVYDDYAIFIPAGKWHNLINTGCTPLKLYSIYAPPEHPRGTIHETKEDAEGYHRH
ncbi:cupin domain-containing protein [Alkaliphilus peptidifermentans]|uniref:Mannose-6-phosphate isomerase, cupin superfamily n=1 Tax=Alkaliphilus peptidifermentans DSM 18978 TaxID=1120976 RepID=A0A1G5LBG4_9FIRM|nr:cupin domain-containing protein [Alkaliphilus peptidifermentans]SCZ10293.1 Mannose-6-phosphate isomerase, cupin superfamily [Alkaliphilus peptidifermentans DSM 18978]